MRSPGFGQGNVGRKETKISDFFIGGRFENKVTVSRVHFKETSDEHCAKDGVISMQRWSAKDCNWIDVRYVSLEERSDILGSGIIRSGKVPLPSELVSQPSRNLTCSVHDCCLIHKIYPIGASEQFSPDDSFFLSENCEGLWVSVSHACGVETLRRASSLVRSLIPEAQRAKWLQFRSPKWAKNAGPMRIIVLDNVSYELRRVPR